MSQFNAKTRTNLFSVHDVEEFRAALADNGLPTCTWQDRDQSGWGHVLDVVVKDGLTGVALCIDGQMPCLEAPEGQEEWSGDRFADLPELVADHLVEGSVAIFVEVGTERFAFFGGTALAINARHETRLVMLDDIYGKAEELVPEGTAITRAED